MHPLRQAECDFLEDEQRSTKMERSGKALFYITQHEARK